MMLASTIQISRYGRPRTSTTPHKAAQALPVHRGHERGRSFPQDPTACPPTPPAPPPFRDPPRRDRTRPGSPETAR
jgi:hypothetical protein